MLLIIKWNKPALDEFVGAIEYISKASVQNGEKVKAEIHTRVNFLADHPRGIPSR